MAKNTHWNSLNPALFIYFYHIRIGKFIYNTEKDTLIIKQVQSWSFTTACFCLLGGRIEQKSVLKGKRMMVTFIQVQGQPD